ncbi:MAG: PqiC family protein [Burkholderiaceae bacterium]
MLHAALVTTLAAMCASCSTPTASERFYALSDGSSSAVTTAATAAKSNTLPGIVISAVTVPELIDRPQIVTRDGANRVNVAEQQLWAEPVKNGIGRVLAVRLTKSLADAGRPAHVAAYPQASIANPDLRITIDVQRFDAVPGGDAVIDVLWSVRRASDDNIRSGRTVASRPIATSTYDDTVRAWSEALEVLNKDIVAVVTQIDLTPPLRSR